MANGIKSQSTICDNEHPTEFVCAVEAVSQSNEEEEIHISLNDEVNCYEIQTADCRIVPTLDKHYHGSSKVKLRNIVDFKWECKHYPGHLVAVHMDQNYLAYAINVNKHSTRMEGMVRVLNVSKGYRSLIKGMSGEVMDLQFAHIEKEHILATGDSNSLFIHKIMEAANSVVCTLLLKIHDPLEESSIPKNDKIYWCPYVEIPGEDDDDNHLIVWARGVLFQCFNVKIISSEYGIGVSKNAADISVGYIKHEDDSTLITCVALSPDGSTLGVGRDDGIIRFYQMYIHDKEPRCLHEWKPHGGKAISLFFFLDNLSERTYETYWKYAITTAEFNTELKVWDCGSWICLQTITFNPSGGRFIAEIDRTSSYLILSCLDSRTCYVLEIIYASRKDKTKSIIKRNANTDSNNIKDNDGITSDTSLRNKASRRNSTGSSSDITKMSCYSSTESQSSNELVCENSQFQLCNSPVYIKSVSAFSLNSGILAFTIVHAALTRYKNPNNYICEEVDEYDEDISNSIYCVTIHMYVVQSKSLQECHILYQTKMPGTISKTSIKEIENELPSSSGADVLSCPSNAIVISRHQLKDNASSLQMHNNNVRSLISNLEEKTTIVDERAEGQIKDINTKISNNIITISERKGSVDGVSINLLEIQEDLPNEELTILRNQQKLMSPFLSVSKNKELMDTSDGNTNMDKKVISVNSSAPLPSSSPSSASITNSQLPTCSKMPIIKNYKTPHAPLISLMTPDAFTSSAGSTQKNPEISNDVFNTIRMLASVTAGTNVCKNISNFAKIEEDVNHLQQQQIPSNDMTNQKFISIDSASVQLAGEHMVSGGSSPSREVQEIMALTTNLDLNAQSGNDLMDWPKPPEIPNCSTESNITKTLQNSELQNAENIYHSLTPISVASVDLQTIDKRIKTILEINKEQSQKIEKLSEEVRKLKSSNSTINTKGSCAEINKRLEAQFWKILEQFIKHYEKEVARISEAANPHIESLYRELRESIISNVQETLHSNINEMICRTLTSEIQTQFIPIVNGKLDTLQKQVHYEFKQKLGAFDEIVRENIIQACKNKTILEILSKTLLSGVQTCLQNALVEAMTKTLIPAYEKSSRNMFQQLNSTFTIGIKDFLSQFENYLRQLQPLHDNADEIIKKLLNHKEHIETLMGHQEAKIQEVIHETRQDIKSINVSLSHRVQDVIQTEIRKSMEAQAAVLRSQANTPALPSFDLKDTIKLLLIQGQINTAFHQALLANDLHLVEYILTNVDHNIVFSPECCLEQKVLLSLIQQISADMSNHNEIKQNYLAEALLAIDLNDAIIREHAPKVLSELFRNCQMFLVNYSKSSQCSNVRMLMKAVQSYKSQF